MQKYRKPLYFALSFLAIFLWGKLYAVNAGVEVVFLSSGLILFVGYLMAARPSITRNSMARTAALFGFGILAGCAMHVLAILPKLGSAQILTIEWTTINWWSLIAISIAAPLFEETLLRGYLCDFLLRFRVPILVILIANGALFVVSHFLPNNFPRAGFFFQLPSLRQWRAFISRAWRGRSECTSPGTS